MSENSTLPAAQIKTQADTTGEPGLLTTARLVGLADEAYAVEEVRLCQRLAAIALVRLGHRTDPVAARCRLLQARSWVVLGQWRELRSGLPALEAFLKS